MVRGFSIVVTAFIACCCFKRKQYLYHLTSLIIIILGISIVGFVSITESSKEGKDQMQSNKSSLLGVILLIFSAIIGGSRYPIEEKIMR